MIAPPCASPILAMGRYSLRCYKQATFD
jgi:hypothetical protein